MSESPEGRRAHLTRLFERQSGKCHICGCDCVLDFAGGKKGSRLSAVRFRTGSSFGALGRVRRRVMACRQCADRRSAEIQNSIPLEERWLRSGREPTEFYEIALKPEESEPK